MDLLEELLLGENQIANTDGLYNLPALRTLDLNTNKLTTLAGIKNLPALQELDVGANSIEKSDSLAGLINFTKLVRFNAAGNPFADELGDKIKFEVLFRIYPWVQIKKIGEDEIGEEDIAQWKAERRERLRQEEDAKRAAEEAARLAEERAAQGLPPEGEGAEQEADE